MKKAIKQPQVATLAKGQDNFISIIIINGTKYISEIPRASNSAALMQASNDLEAIKTFINYELTLKGYKRQP